MENIRRPEGQRRSGFSKRCFAHFIVATVVLNCSQLSLSINNWGQLLLQFPLRRCLKGRHIAIVSAFQAFPASPRVPGLNSPGIGCASPPGLNKIEKLNFLK